MLVCLPGILDRTRLAAVLAVAGRPEGFADGGPPAGFRARRVKHNLQLPKTAPDAVRAGAMVAEALEADQIFQRAVLPKALLPPLFSRYEPGMGYGPHTD